MNECPCEQCGDFWAGCECPAYFTWKLTHEDELDQGNMLEIMGVEETEH